LNFPDRFLKRSGIKFYTHLFIESRVVPCESTDRHDETNRWLTQFCESA